MLTKYFTIPKKSRMILIEIDGNPIPWKSHGGFGKRSFNPRNGEREKIQWQIRAQYNQISPLTGPIRCSYTYFMPIPKTISNIRRLQMLNGLMHPIKRPDIDNLNKFLSDTLIGLIIEDDSQIVSLTATKIYGERPKTVIKLEAICH